MFYLFAVPAGLMLILGAWMVLASTFKLLFRKGDRTGARNELVGGLIGAPLVAMVLLFVAQWIDPQAIDPAAREARAAATALQEEEALREQEARLEAEREAALRAEEECRRSIQCWGDRHFVAASVRCVRPIERLANYSMEWTDGILEPKFSHFRWSPLGDGIVVYIGDSARFQNGFGAWQNVVYECTYDPGTEQALDATARAGRL